MKNLPCDAASRQNSLTACFIIIIKAYASCRFPSHRHSHLNISLVNNSITHLSWRHSADCRWDGQWYTFRHRELKWRRPDRCYLTWTPTASIHIVNHFLYLHRIMAIEGYMHITICQSVARWLEVGFSCKFFDNGWSHNPSTRIHLARCRWTLINCFQTDSGHCTSAYPAAKSGALQWLTSDHVTNDKQCSTLSASEQRPSWRVSWWCCCSMADGNYNLEFV